MILDISNKVLIGAAFAAIAIFLGLGIAGYGDDTGAAAFVYMGFTHEWAGIFSKLLLGLFSFLAGLLFTLGCLDDHEGYF